MAELVTIARPYAEAVFRIARESQAFADWSRMLSLCATVAKDPQMAALIHDPNVPAAELARLFLGVCGSELNDAGRNFIQLLSDNDRLALLPTIAELYEALRREHENELEAVITSAFPLTETQVQDLVAALERRFACRVKARTQVDPDLIGGARITVGDVVIDGSVAGQLAKMASALKS
ncbi:F0F1 ATP synthase subunit delta [Thiobacter aerophilum]|uniref:ATP synthase subunit delta n=1 Tax=Thiobacter aerophilum TaxID=3121275 RepID=A0ABV0EGB1_9BURK